jgi:hypothetical protein
MGTCELYKHIQPEVVLGWKAMSRVPAARSYPIGFHKPTTLRGNVNHTQISCS